MPKRTQAVANDSSIVDEVPTKKSAEEPKKSAEVEPEQEAESTEEVYTTDRKSESGQSYNLKISAWNVGGMKAWIKKGGLDYLKKESPDIFLAQETKVDASKPPPEADLEGYHITYNAAEKKGYSGVALFSKEEPISVTKGIGIEEHDKEGRLITAEFKSFYFVGVYVPNSGRKLVRLDYRQEWDKAFLDYLKKLDQKKPVICCGDMNVAHEEIDLKNPKSNRNKTPGFSDQEREGFTNLLDEGFVDSFRHLYPDKAEAYSFWTYMGNCRAKNVGWRLDYAVISKALVPKLCDNAMRTQTFGSDHCPIVVYLAM